jgi:hypothetical protein
MATWTTLPDATLEPGKPIRSIDVLALRDNPVAIAEGEIGAPRTWGKAAKRLSTYPVLTVSAADTHVADIGAGLVLGAAVTIPTTNVVAATYTLLLYTGSIRFKATHAGSTGDFGSVQSILTLFKNGTQVTSFSTVSPASRVVDVAIVPGDVIEWRHRTNVGLGPSTVSNIVATASNAYQAIPLYIAASDL